MNCQECREEIAAYLEDTLDAESRKQMDSHLAECDACQIQLRETHELTARLTRNGLAAASVSIETAVMDRILQEQALLIRRLKMRRRIRVLGMSGAMAASVAILFIGSLWFTQPAEAQKAAETLAKGAEAVSNPTTVHIVAKIRTIPHDNFSLIGAKYDLVPVEVWVRRDKPQWRVEKPGRVAVMDGKSTTMLIRPNVGVRFPKASPSAFDAQWLLGLADVHNLLTRELRNAQAQGWKLKNTEETTETGRKRLVVNVEATAGVPDADYSKNKWINSSDMRRVYRFDAKTQRLEGFEAYLHQPGGDVLVAVIDQIEYDQTISPEIFTLKFPKDIVWYQEPARLADNEKYENRTPEETAKAFFEACERRDWKEVEKYYSPLDQRIKEHLGGLKLVSLGKPFRSEKYPGWFVPYEIKLTMKVPFEVGYDNPAKRCIVFNAGQRPDAKQLAQIKPLPDNEKYQKMTPKEAVETLLRALEAKNARELWNLSDGSVPIEKIEKDFISQDQQFEAFRVGEPTPATEPGYWDVPVEVSFVKKHNLAVRKDNPANRYIVDGGI